MYFKLYGIFIIISLLLVLPGCARTGKVQPRVQKGVIDLSGWDLAKDGPVTLNGEWEFCWKKFLSPGQCISGDFPARKNFLSVPSVWDSYITSSYPEFGGLRKGYGTFFIRIKGLPVKEKKDLALKLSAMQSLYSLYFIPQLADAAAKLKMPDLKPLMQNGIIATNERDAVPQYVSQLKRIPDYAESNYLIIHISNYYFSTIALSKELVLGTNEDVQAISNRNALFSFFIIGIVFFMSVYHLMLYLFSRKLREYLLFGLICFFISIWYLLWAGFVSELFPKPSHLVHFIIESANISSYAIVLPLFAAFFRKLFKDEMPWYLVIMTVVVSSAYIILRILKLPLDHYVFFYYNMFIIFSSILGFFILVRATIRRRPGSLLILIGYIIFIISVCHDILQANLIIFSNVLLVPYGLVAYIFAQSIIFTKTYAHLAEKAEAARAEILACRYNKSYLAGIDVENVKNRLVELMEKEKIYRDEDLSIKSLADRLEITLHQLSEILNTTLNSNFFNYVNSYRIMETKKLLKEDVTRPIISIAFEVGFNSTTSFYRTFKKFTGKTPQECRDENQ